MKRKPVFFVQIFVALALLLSLGLAGFAPADAAEWGGAAAVAPTGGWEQLDAGRSRWYSFEYAGDRSQVQVRLKTVPAGSAEFVVWTPELIERWGLGQGVNPIGRGSEDPTADGVLTWSGSFITAGTYYVVVEGAEGTNGTSTTLLNISGEGVSFGASAPASTPVATSAAKAAVTPSKSALASQLTGKLVFQTTYGGALYTINADGSSLQRLASGIDPAWSPDGEQVAYVSWENPRGVWIVDANPLTGTGGSNARRVFDWNETRYPSWSADGTVIVFSRTSGGDGGGGAPSAGPSGAVAGRHPRPGGPGGAPGGGSSGGTLGVVNASDGTFWEPQPVSTTNLTPDYSPSGDQIVLATNNGLMVQSVDGQESWQLTTNPYDTTPAWSPDGTKVAFLRRQHDHWEIYVIDVNTAQQARLTSTPAVDGVAASSVSPAWSPDGDHIAFLTDRTGEWGIWVMAADGSAQGPLFTTELDGLTLDYAFAGERAIDWTE
jgi:hypothetical protein